MIFSWALLLTTSAVHVVHGLPVAEPDPAVAYKTIDLPPVVVTVNTYTGPVKYITSTGQMHYSTASTPIANPAQTSTSPSPTASTLSVTPYELVYSPYNDDTSCKDASTVLSDLQLIASKGVKSIRVYATDCNSLQTVEPQALSLGLQITQCIWVDSSGINSGDDQVAELIAYGQQSGWNGIRRVLVGNEGISNGWYTADQMVSKLQSVRSQLRAAGYSGPVSTADIVSSYQNNPQLCGAVDFVGGNIEPFFNPGTDAAQAGQFVASQAQLLQQVCPNLQVSVTETGYPHCGSADGNNVPNPTNQFIALNSILEAFNGQVTVLTPFADLWKNPGPYGVEQCFGMIQLL